jgi:hypothetical protein
MARMPRKRLSAFASAAALAVTTTLGLAPAPAGAGVRPAPRYARPDPAGFAADLAAVLRVDPARVRAILARGPLSEAAVVGALARDLRIEGATILAALDRVGGRS